MKTQARKEPKNPVFLRLTLEDLVLGIAGVGDFAKGLAARESARGRAGQNPFPLAGNLLLTTSSKCPARGKGL